MLDCAPAVFIPEDRKQAPPPSPHIAHPRLPQPLALLPAMTIPSHPQAADLEVLKAQLQALQVQVLRAQLKVLSQKVAALATAKEEGF